MTLNQCWICGSPTIGTGQHTLSAGVPIGMETRGVCEKHIASVVLYQPFFEDHTINDAEYDWLRDREVKK